MRKFFITLAVIMTLTIHPITGTGQAASLEFPASKAAAKDHRLLAVGAGAIVGIVTFNMLTYPFGSVPFVTGPLASTPLDIALGSRLLAIISAGAGALLVHYLYPLWDNSSPATQ